MFKAQKKQSKKRIKSQAKDVPIWHPWAGIYIIAILTISYKNMRLVRIPLAKQWGGDQTVPKWDDDSF